MDTYWMSIVKIDAKSVKLGVGRNSKSTKTRMPKNMSAQLCQILYFLINGPFIFVLSTNSLQ